MSIERLWLLANKRRSERGREPVTLSKVQRIVWWFFGRPPTVFVKRSPPTYRTTDLRRSLPTYRAPSIR